MIPLRDSVPASRTPVVTYALLAVTCGVFLLQLGDPDGALIRGYGMVPARLLGRTGWGALGPAAVPDWVTPLSCVFLHGGWLHLLGNMWFLWIFGDNVEDRLGRVGFLLFYLAAGVLASLTQLATMPGSSVPTIGASGAIAGVMGAYMLLYPHSRVLTLVPIVFIWELIVLPAPLFLGIWFALQFFQGAASISGQDTAGVAWWAHVGGFAAGAAVAWLLRLFRRLRPQPPTYELRRRRVQWRDPWR